MIVRDEGDTFLLITQPDHAQLAEGIMALIQTEPALGGPGRHTILRATREHDNGWTEVDAEPTIDAETLRPCDFMSGPAPVTHELIMNGQELEVAPDPFAGATIPLRVLGRRIPARRYRDDADLRAAMAAAIPEVIVGQARGGACTS